MPKAKTKKSAAKRFIITGRGKVMRYQAGKNHLLEWKSAKKKRPLTKKVPVSKTESKNIRALLPYA